MDFYSLLELKFTEYYTDHIHLDQEEWSLMIMTFCLELAEKPIGKLLLDKLCGFINSGYKITIANSDEITMSLYIYPKIRYINSTSVLVIIPSVPYFVNVEVVDSNKIKDIEDENLVRVAYSLPAVSCLKSSSYYQNNQNGIRCISLERMPPIIGFSHELIHCLRHFEKISAGSSNEEDCTIYGLESNLLKYNLGYITENTIRKDFGFKPRISHSSSEIYCWRAISTYSNASKFTKQDFFS